MNKQSFNLKTITEKAFTLSLQTKKSFSLKVIEKKFFDLVVFGISLVDIYVLKLENTKFNLVSSLKSRVKVISTIKTGIYNVVTIVKQRQKFPITISFTENLSFTPKQHKKVSVTFNTIFGFLSHLTSNLLFSTSITSGTYVLTVTPVFRGYYYLNDYDTQTLADMDVFTLQELDYQLV